ncbi:MAG: hypothetical protein COX48_04620 [bacterium (Candidatus Stahlbacteria) CG23_combo_of_CG06-09_8_20_14_all_34_7]|nr:MAG: hypothetical protein COX48_04620 [bacterium (Candidatus Stahlbacteria) CG23_combo_of_CG06-09_8_20_14_all_34_7]
MEILWWRCQINKKELDKIIEAYIEKNAFEFLKIKPTVKTVSTDIDEYKKQLNIKAKKTNKKVFSYTFVLNESIFKKVLFITITESGKIIKISKSK